MPILTSCLWWGIIILGTFLGRKISLCQISFWSLFGQILPFLAKICILKLYYHQLYSNYTKWFTNKLYFLLENREILSSVEVAGGENEPSIFLFTGKWWLSRQAELPTIPIFRQMSWFPTFSQKWRKIASKFVCFYFPVYLVNMNPFAFPFFGILTN